VDATTKETGDAVTFCEKGNVVWASDKLHSHIELDANDFFQSALAQCPHNETNCVAAAKVSAGTVITIAD
jgi:uncharacterized RmlC-like cupin family protein